MTDEEIIRLFFERSEQAITELSKEHGSAAARVARNILGSERDAEECLNDTYLAVWNARSAADVRMQDRAQSCRGEVPRQHREKAKQPLRRRAR